MAPTVTLTKQQQQPLVALRKNNVKLPKLCIKNVLKPGVHFQPLPSTITFLEQLCGTAKERQQKTSAFQPIIITSENQPQIKTVTVTTKEKQIEPQLLQPKSIEQQVTKHVIQQPQQITNPIPVENGNEIMLTFDSTDELLLVKEEPEIMEAQDVTLIPDLLEDSPPAGKKRRLEGLTYEQKAYRKKLKNRLAAQNSRDRKKAKVEELEKSLVTLREENTKLVEENRTLEERNKSLTEEMEALRSASQALKEEMERIKGSQSKCSCGSNPSPVTVVECTDSTLGSAVSSNPLQQGGPVQTTSRRATEDSLSELVANVAFFLLLKVLLLDCRKKNGSASLNTWLTQFLTSFPPGMKEKLLSYAQARNFKRAQERKQREKQMVKAMRNSVLLGRKWWGRNCILRPTRTKP
ncbi:uncharacterized protein LOC106648386 [Trichogramma pretiosum]|uniref:uncharacterized protein LOC106648386 n=1 Tax=Trichogramma pretiosum TaxID=7493 RepID=UPI0006C94F63|nr:uncharacterized protein LOC106648386 [Trichogramma pretiosum]